MTNLDLVPYPDSFPGKCLKELLRILIDRRTKEENALFMHCFWHLQGYLQKLLLGEPQPTDHRVMADDSVFIARWLKILQGIYEVEITLDRRMKREQANEFLKELLELYSEVP